jgi:3-hydroxybutyryl-CoA dehydrogenase
MMENLVASGAKGVSNAQGFYPYTDEKRRGMGESIYRFQLRHVRKLAEKYPQHIGIE